MINRRIFNHAGSTNGFRATSTFLHVFSGAQVLVHRSPPMRKFIFCSVACWRCSRFACENNFQLTEVINRIDLNWRFRTISFGCSHRCWSETTASACRSVRGRCISRHKWFSWLITYGSSGLVDFCAENWNLSFAIWFEAFAVDVNSWSARRLCEWCAIHLLHKICFNLQMNLRPATNHHRYSLECLQTKWHKWNELTVGFAPSIFRMKIYCALTKVNLFTLPRARQSTARHATIWLGYSRQKATRIKIQLFNSAMASVQCPHNGDADSLWFAFDFAHSVSIRIE